MADIRRYPFFRHLRAEPSTHVLHYRRGRLVRSGRGLAFWYRPMVSGLAELPLDDREQPFLFVGRTIDFQEVNVQGAITFRVADPETLAQRVDFSIHVDKGTWLAEPMAQLQAIVTQLAQQSAFAYLAHKPLRTVLQEGVEELRERIEAHLRGGEELAGMGLELVSVRIARVAPTAELEKALQAPTRELLQQAADEALFQRRALAVEKERAIAENELQNKIELARREQNLIQQEGANERHRHEELAAARRIEIEANVQMQRVQATTDAEVVRTKAAADAEAVDLVDQAKNRAEAMRLEAYGKLPAGVVLGLALRELAGKLRHIDRLSLGNDGIGGLLADLLQAKAAQPQGAVRVEGRDA